MRNFKRLIFFVFCLIITFLTAIVPVYAKLSVGVTTGKIQVDERLISGTIYKLPVFNVINTGDEGSDYEVSVAYRENQEGMRPPLEWFNFEPQTFYLEPGESQSVEIELRLPIETVPGDYFCFIEAHPVLKESGGKTQIGISAAGKLYFTIASSSLWEGIYYRFLSLWTKYQPWSSVAGGVIVGVLVLMIVKKFVKVEVRFNRRSKKSKDNDKKSEK